MPDKSPEELRREADEVEQGRAGAGEGKNPGRVAGGKRAAATRKERYGSAAPGAGRRNKE
jgi:hypothetical protein